MILFPEREDDKRGFDPDKLDELVEDGCYVIPRAEDDLEYWFRDAILMRERLGRPLTDEEMMIFRIGCERPGIAKVRTKGQITIPIDVRKRLSIEEGDEIGFYQANGKIYVKNLRIEEEMLKK